MEEETETEADTEEEKEEDEGIFRRKWLKTGPFLVISL